MIAVSSFYVFREVVGEVCANQLFARRPGDFHRGLVHVRDFAFGADRDERVHTGFNQAPCILRRLLLQGDIADRAGDLHALLSLHRTQPHLYLKSSSVLALAVEVKAGAHPACGWLVEETSAVSRVGTPESLRSEHFDRL